MTKGFSGVELANRVNESYPEIVIGSDDVCIFIEPYSIPVVSGFLKNTPGLEFESLTSISAVDYVEYFELVYHLTSMKLNQSAVLKSRCYGREDPIVPSVLDVWRGAELQEREIWDLMGIRFEGRQDMKRILLWEDFDGHPLRKDFLS